VVEAQRNGTSLASGSAMLTMMTIPGLTLLFLGVVVGLGTAFVWVFWEMERVAKARLAKVRRDLGFG
jgi:predicted negative regulator of RcsB-dependent stress response